MFDANDRYADAQRQIDAIEAELRRLGWWQAEPLPPEKMQFSAAFAIDTMAFSQWLQFIFVPRVRQIIAEQGEFPPVSHVGAQAVREYDGQDEAIPLTSLLSEFDQFINAGQHGRRSGGVGASPKGSFLFSMKQFGIVTLLGAWTLAAMVGSLYAASRLNLRLPRTLYWEIETSPMPSGLQARFDITADVGLGRPGPLAFRAVTLGLECKVVPKAGPGVIRIPAFAMSRIDFLTPAEKAARAAHRASQPAPTLRFVPPATSRPKLEMPHFDADGRMTTRPADPPADESTPSSANAARTGTEETSAPPSDAGVRDRGSDGERLRLHTEETEFELPTDITKEFMREQSRRLYRQVASDAGGEDRVMTDADAVLATFERILASKDSGELLALPGVARTPALSATRSPREVGHAIKDWMAFCAGLALTVVGIVLFWRPLMAIRREAIRRRREEMGMYYSGPPEYR